MRNAHMASPYISTSNGSFHRQWKLWGFPPVSGRLTGPCRPNSSPGQLQESIRFRLKGPLAAGSYESLCIHEVARTICARDYTSESRSPLLARYPQVFGSVSGPANIHLVLLLFPIFYFFSRSSAAHLHVLYDLVTSRPLFNCQ